jgi:hypothetical protein
MMLIIAQVASALLHDDVHEVLRMDYVDESADKPSHATKPKARPTDEGNDHNTTRAPSRSEGLNTTT